MQNQCNSSRCVPTTCIRSRNTGWARSSPSPSRAPSPLRMRQLGLGRGWVFFTRSVQSSMKGRSMVQVKREVWHQGGVCDGQGIQPRERRHFYYSLGISFWNKILKIEWRPLRTQMMSKFHLRKTQGIDFHHKINHYFKRVKCKTRILRIFVGWCVLVSHPPLSSLHLCKHTPIKSSSAIFFKWILCLLCCTSQRQPLWLPCRH